jgi:excinuclease ABC subunit C
MEGSRVFELFQKQAGAGLGASFLTGESVPAYVVTGTRTSMLRARVQQEGPRRPGVYAMWDAHGEIIYIGKARSLRARLLSYFRKSRDPKAGHILRATRAIGWETVPDEFGALLRELELIRRWQPRFNVVGLPRGRRLAYVCIGRLPAPGVYLSVRPKGPLVACYGPIAHSRRARDAVRRINDWYQLRDCPKSQAMHFADEEVLFPLERVAGCMRHELGTCLGPCAGACTQSSYLQRVQQALEFLQQGHSPMESMLEARMSTAAGAHDYEYAAALRDQLASICWLRERLERLHHAAQRYTFIYPVRGHNQHDRWYLIRDGRVQRVLRHPRTEEEHAAAQEAVAQVYLRTEAPPAVPLLEELDAAYLVMSWFRRRPAELQRCWRPQKKTGTGLLNLEVLSPFF